mgnify:CR=1 FL=1
MDCSCSNRLLCALQFLDAERILKEFATCVLGLISAEA